MILSAATAVFGIVTLYLGSSVLASNIDVFYVFLVIQVFLVMFIKIAHHSSESQVRFDRLGGWFVFFASSAILLYGLQHITSSIIFQGV